MKRIKIYHNEMNYLKDDGTYLFDENVKFCWYFNNGFGMVKYKDLTYNYVNTEGKQLLKTNVEDTRDFYNGFAFVEINDIWYFIDKECNFYNKDKVSFKDLYNLYHQKDKN